MNKKDKTISYLIKSGFNVSIDKNGIYTTIIKSDSQLTDICTFLFHENGIFMETISNFRHKNEIFRTKVDDVIFDFILIKS